MTLQIHFFAKIFGHIKKKQYLCTRFSKKLVSLAQLVEQLTLNQWVESSSLSGDTKGAVSTFFSALLSFFGLFALDSCIYQKFLLTLQAN